MSGLPSISTLLRAIRAHLALSQEQLAGQMDVATSTVHRWETGRCEPQPDKLKVIEAIAREAGIDVYVGRAWENTSMNGEKVANKTG